MAKTTRFDLTAGLILILPGIALTLISTHFDSFVKGMCQGAGVMLMLIGVWLIGAHRRRPRTDDSDGMWLPSRDTPGREHEPRRDQR